MRLHIGSKYYYTNYIVHPLSKDLSKKERIKALISSIAFGILSLGICPLVCAIKYRGKRERLESLKELYQLFNGLEESVEKPLRWKKKPLPQTEKAKGHEMFVEESNISTENPLTQ